MPFYISELLISIAYIFFLIKVYKNKEIEILDSESESDRYEHVNVNKFNRNEDEAFSPTKQ